MNDMAAAPDSDVTVDALPEVIGRYQDAHDRHDIDGAASAFTPDADVTDEGRTYRGGNQIRAWLVRTSAEYTFTRTLLSAQPAGDERWLVRNRLEGDFPGGVVELGYQFQLDGGLISSLTIAA
jgi:hypothetical protein